MSNPFYEETLLKEEFRLVAKLQEDPEFSKYVSVAYEDRHSGEERSVSLSPVGLRYPETYSAQYRMPVYVSPGQLRKDWRGTATMQLSEPVLTNKHSHHGPHVTFHSNFTPYNNHVLQNSICSGNAWVVARDNGLWHFIISLGALINQDEFVSAEGAHYNPGAYNYWLSRDRRPVTSVKWPLDLLSKLETTINISPKRSESSSLKIVPRTVNITKKPKSIDIRVKPTAPASIRITPKKG